MNVIFCPPSVFGVCANVRAFPVIFPVGPAWTLRLEDNAVLLPKKNAELSDIVTPPAVAVVNVAPTLLKLIVLLLHVGAELGFPLGISDGMALGLRLGPPDGFELGLALGLALGFLLGISDGLALGFPLGISDIVGDLLGLAVGIAVGVFVGD